MTTQVFDQQGHPIPLGRELGRGGEGAVYELAADAKRIAKVYHKPVEPAKARKLRAMSALTSPDVLAVAAWPIATLHGLPGGPVIGCMQPRAQGREVHELFGPSNRARTFPKADWRFLAHTAMNCASAFATIHARGHVIGDVNSKNVWVANQATVSMVDCDSFQIRNGPEKFLCEVGVDEFTPPELQGLSFRTVERTPNHDCFGLSILVFKLLFMGRHPFVGRFSGTGDMPVDRAIKEFRFAFGTDAARFQMAPPPFVPAIRYASSELQSLFEQAFAPASVRPDGRPTAARWHNALVTFEKQLRKCPTDAGHLFHASSPSCPWCEILRVGGPSFFISVTIAQGAAKLFEMDLGEIRLLVSRIGQASVPLIVVPLRQLPGRGRVPIPTMHYTALVLRKFLPRVSIGAAVATVASAGFFLLVPPALATVILSMMAALLAVFGGWLWTLRVTSPYGKERRARRAHLNQAIASLRGVQHQLEQVTAGFGRQAGDLRIQVTSFEQQLQGLKGEYERERQELEKNRKANQLKDFLSTHYLQRASIPKVPKAIVATLISYGIESADDIEDAAITNVPGVGPVRKTALLEWRRNIELQFRFDPSKGVSPHDLAGLAAKYERNRQVLKAKLGAALEEILQARQLADRSVRSLTSELSIAATTLAKPKPMTN